MAEQELSNGHKAKLGSNIQRRDAVNILQVDIGTLPQKL
eukprot:CAMPEP_0198339472 /NCGR_PEP_ID=MMETSP1450-20131203/40242_1 /TAXON_ID=753684 ORGANISM="Madagascaria erythrocladiodes, Strain CCMP3234" /NCGR_SAMPLE_ID=MMETSP1450 /ASSEMBLY_ACC=CAM_ASM_001115 /LENGTH=38 /DNA_ID= /DNA_START= /DNA_END= /DNA_ORIENTATION=